MRTEGNSTAVRGLRGAKTAVDSALGGAHAKAILLGEHAVVYGARAIAVPLHALRAVAEVRPRAHGTHIVSELFRGDADDAPARIQPLLAAIYSAQERTGQKDRGIDLDLRSSIPYERGLGSSAAVAAAVARAVARLGGVELSGDEVFAVAMDAERIAHGKSSGLDGRTVCSETPISFRAGQVEPMTVGSPLVLVLADSGRAGSTSHAVGLVKRHLVDEPGRVSRLIDRLGVIAEESIAPVAAGDLPALGAHMSEAHRHLAALGVSDTVLDRLVGTAMAAGAHGAKMSGGGLGGCIMALARSEESGSRIEHALRAAGAVRTWTTTVGAA